MSQPECQFTQIDDREWWCVEHDKVIVGGSMEPVTCTQEADNEEKRRNSAILPSADR